MSQSPKVVPTDDTLKNQALAADPTKSIWVSANAGSGKTHILTQRVLRLLLNGVAPENILCLTYTKAAAAEMKIRVANSLSNWTSLSDKDLTDCLKKITGKFPSADDLVRARMLFALALETPGGLKISTIHAFCEASLHRFPLEADVPVNFSVIEEGERARLVQLATDKVLATGLSGNQEAGDAVANLFSLVSDDGISTAIKSALGQGQNLRKTLKQPGITKQNLRKLVKFDPARTLETINEDIISNSFINAALCRELIDVLGGDPHKTTGVRFVDVLSRADPERLLREDLFNAFLTKESKPRATLAPQTTYKKHPDLLEPFEKERERIVSLFKEYQAVSLVMRSEALLSVVGAIHTIYEEKKAASDQLDFDDLIIKFEQLLTSKVSSDWVRYKLDAGMIHVLVDESQDTNPNQWRVVRLLVDEFFSGDGATQTERTVFGVGDEKQSIFGFQGAEPKLFGETGEELSRLATQSGKTWENVRFPASFRTQENILMGVDELCKRPDIAAALLAAPTSVQHESARADKGGSITLWPPIDCESADKSKIEWLESPAPSFKNNARLAAERIVTQVEHWLISNRPLGARQRTVCADDILILVQTRSPVFHEIVRALKLKNIPTAGADKLSVTDHILVHDLMALGDILLTPQDDLTLSSVLRSPLFDISLAQLEEICTQRGKEQSVWQALETAAKTKNWANIAFEDLRGLAHRLDRERPYEFFAELLYAHGGLKKFHSRLGEEIDEVAEAFLDLALEHEQNSQPSLQGFLAEMRSTQIEVKRELSEGGTGVRVMTVHGAKGLEAPIVILADANKKPSLKQTVFLQSDGKPYFVHGAKELDHTPETLEHFKEPAKDKEVQEYWRKLYVAMTRAEDELYITCSGPLSKTDLASSQPQPSWYGAIAEALAGDFCEVDLIGETEKGLRYPQNLVIEETIEPDGFHLKKSPPRHDPAPLPDFMPIETIRPSRAYEEGTDKQFSDVETGDLDAETARKRGTTLHNLLEHLAPLGSAAPSTRHAIALEALKKLHAHEPDMHGELVQKALAILSGKDAEFLFGPNSRAELPIFVFGKKNQKPIQIIGRIDRIVALDKTITLIDFKSNARPPSDQSQISQNYKTQMGLYLKCGQKLFPDHFVETAIYWTSNETLMALDNDELLSATHQFNIT